jgi:hypothetical protein
MYRLAMFTGWMLIVGVSAVRVQATSPYSCVTYGSELGAKWLYPTGLNNKGQVAGSYSTISDPIYADVRSFLREPDGTIKSIVYPGAMMTYAYTINNLGQVAGTYMGSDSVHHGFVRNADGSFQSIDAPTKLGDRSFDARYFWVYGINDAGELLGTMVSPHSSEAGRLFHFTRDAIGQYLIFDPKNFDLTDVGVNNFPFTAGPISNLGDVLENFNAGGIDGSSVERFADGSSISLFYPWYESGSPRPTQVDGFNAAGFQAGFTVTSLPVGFVHTPDGHWPAVTCPGAQYVQNAQGVQPYAINDKGTVGGATGAGADPFSGSIGFLAFPTGIESKLSLSHTSWTFATHNIGETSGEGRIYLASEGRADLHIEAIELGGLKTEDHSSDYEITANTCLTSTQIGSYLPATLPSGKECSFSFHFTPSEGGRRPAQIVIFDDAPDAPHIISIDGVGNGSGLQLSNQTWTFASHPVGQISGPGAVYVYNPGTQTLQISSVRLSGFTPQDFCITGNTCPADLAPYATCKVSFLFAPTQVGLADAELEFATNDRIAISYVVLFGNGTATQATQ